nr:MAG TPA: hypothetical protein [Bacteriophage sp.]
MYSRHLAAVRSHVADVVLGNSRFRHLKGQPPPFMCSEGR